MTYAEQVAHESERVRRIEAFAHQAEVRALRYQLDPHFLFNTLNSISSLVVSGKNVAAEAMLAGLSRLFRLTLSIDPTTDITVEEEIGLQRTYLEIEQSRFPDLKVRLEVDLAATQAPLPALLLQPLVENAVKYGVTTRDAPSTITIAASAHGSRLHIFVRNDSDSPSQQVPAGTGTGLRTTRDRLGTHFPGNFKLDAVPWGKNGFEVFIDIPLGLNA
jgi:LytS/YehU family sensor histidine kinase